MTLIKKNRVRTNLTTFQISKTDMYPSLYNVLQTSVSYSAKSNEIRNKNIIEILICSTQRNMLNSAIHVNYGNYI